MKGVIYCYHCISTGKKYIGQTDNERRRKYEHIYQSKAIKKNGYKCKFYNAVRKYGWDNFIYGIIECVDVEHLNDREVYLIEFYDTFKNGYNTNIGGKGCRGFKLSEETKEKLRKKALGRKVTEETRKKLKLAGVSQRPEVRKKISEANKGDKNPMYGKHHTEETKRKIRNANSGKKRNPFTQEHKEKISRANKGRKMTEEQIQKRLKSIVGKYKGKNNKNTKKHYLTFDDGTTTIVDDGIIAWCKNNEYSVSGLYEIKSGKRKNYKGIINFKTILENVE